MEVRFEAKITKYEESSHLETKYPQSVIRWTFENAMVHGHMYLGLKAMNHEIWALLRIIELRFKAKMTEYKQSSHLETKYSQKAIRWIFENAMVHGPKYLGLNLWIRRYEPYKAHI